MRITKRFLVFVLSAFLMLTGSIAAQQTGNESQTTAEPKVERNSTLDTVNSTESVVVDTAKSSSYQQIARDMTIKLLQKMNITFDQAADIEKILIDYQKDIADARNSGTAHGTDQSVTNTDTDKEDRTATEDDHEILGGMNNDENLNEIDRETNSDIEDVLDDNQISSYMFVKEDWWNELKSKVYGTEENNQNDQNMNNEQNTDQNMNHQNQNDQDMNNQQNTDQNTQDQGTTDQNQGQTGNDVSPDTGKAGQYNTTPSDSSK